MLKPRRLIGLLLIAMVAPVASAGVSVKRDPPDVQYKTFDPAKPPAEMPHLRPGEDAVTTTSFRIQAGANYEVISRKKDDDGWTTLVGVHGLTTRLQLHVVVWTPAGVSDKLKAHEDGHRKISEQIYADRAIDEAKAAGALIDGKRLSGQGANWKAAAGNAVDPAINDVGKTYMQRTADIADAVNNIYDELTQHGTNNKPEAQAIKEAFAKYAADHPTTQPVQEK